MSEHAREIPARPDVSHLVTEDDEPVDNLHSEKGQRLLTEALYASWQGPPHEDDEGDVSREPRKFLAAANVGIFATPDEDAIVPDAFVATDVSLAELTYHPDESRSYFVWRMGKPPELVIEIVSNRVGDELGRKRRRYGRMHVSHYVVFDPWRLLGDAPLRAYTLGGDVLRAIPVAGDRIVFGELGLGLCLWDGPFEGTSSRWLRFTDGNGRVLPTGAERAEHEKQRAEHEKQRAEHEKQRAEHEKQRAEHEKQRAEHEKQRADRLAEQLRALGVEPEG